MLRERIGEPLEGAIAAVARIGERQLDGKTEARIIEELNDLAAERFTRLDDPSMRLRRLRNTLEQFERRIAAGAS
jgi:hypothetical protein